MFYWKVVPNPNHTIEHGIEFEGRRCKMCEGYFFCSEVEPDLGFPPDNMHGREFVDRADVILGILTRTHKLLIVPSPNCYPAWDEMEDRTWRGRP